MNKGIRNFYYALWALVMVALFGLLALYFYTRIF